MKRINSLLIVALLLITALSCVRAELGYYFLAGRHWNIAYGATIGYFIYQGGSPDIPDDSEMSAVQAAFQTWENDVKSYVDFTWGGWVDDRNRGGRRDGVNVVDFIDLTPETAYAVTYIWPEYGQLIDECDMVFNERYDFSTNLTPNTFDVQNLATHEAGHFLALQNLLGSGDSEETMYWNVYFQETKKRTLEWGDRAGAAYIYPHRSQVTGGLGQYTQGADIAVGDIWVKIQQPLYYDYLVAWVDNPSGANSIKYRFGWDINKETGQAYWWSSTYAMSDSVGTETAGLGTALAYLGGSDTKVDMVLLWVDNPSGANTIYYKIGWDLDASVNPQQLPTSWSSRKTVPSSDVGSETQGAAVAFANLDGNSRPEMIVCWVDNLGGENAIYYKIGWNVNTYGNPTSWSSRFSKSGWVGTETSDVGIALTNVGGSSNLDMIIFWVDAPYGANHGKYQIGYDLDSSGAVSPWGGIYTFPGDWQWVGDSTAGAGVAAIDFNSNGRKEMIFLWVDDPIGDNYGYYRIEWEGCLDSHY